MTDQADVAAALQGAPGSTAVELRDVLRSSGRVSITVADVTRVLASHPRRFRASSDVPARWTLASGPPPREAPPPQARRGSDRTLSWPGAPLYRWQLDALDAWRARQSRGVIDAVTGTGKTMVGVVAVWEELGRGGQACVLVPTNPLLHQWHRVLSGLAPPGTRIGMVGDGHRDHFGTCDVVVAIVNSARTADLRPRRPGGLLVADECHRYGSEVNRLVLRADYVRRLGLSATYARSDDAHHDRLDPYFGGRCFRLGFRRALAEGVVAPFHLVLVGVRFSPTEYAEYADLGCEMAACRHRLLRDGRVRPEPIGAFLGDVARCARGGDDVAPTAVGYLRAMAERRRLLAETPAKLVALDRLVSTVEEATRTIVFTQSIEAAEQAAARLCRSGVAAATVHSGLDTITRADRMTEFEAGAVTALCAPEILDEGVDVPAADLAIILAASRSRRQMVQRMGRVMRRKPDGRHAHVVNVYVEATNEDPAAGAHERFLNEITPLATSVSTRRASDDL